MRKIWERLDFAGEYALDNYLAGMLDNYLAGILNVSDMAAILSFGEQAYQVTLYDYQKLMLRYMLEGKSVYTQKAIGRTTVVGFIAGYYGWKYSDPGLKDAIRKRLDRNNMERITEKYFSWGSDFRCIIVTNAPFEGVPEKPERVFHYMTEGWKFTQPDDPRSFILP